MKSRHGGISEIGEKIRSLGMFDRLPRFMVAFCPKGTVLPYFCTMDSFKDGPADACIALLEGWETLHDYVRSRADVNFGYRHHDFEFPQFRLFFPRVGGVKLFRHDIGYVPKELDGNALAERMLWQAYGVMMRLEEDPKLPMKFAGERSMFGRVEVGAGKWEDRPVLILPPREIVESVTFRNEDLQAAKDLPMAKDDVVDLDFSLMPHLASKEPRPRCVYELRVVDHSSGDIRFISQVSMLSETGLKTLWEEMPQQVLKNFVRIGRFPSEIRVVSGRVFRILRPLCMELPFKLSLHDRFK